MSLLDRYFALRATRGLAVYPVHVPGESSLEPGFLYLVDGAHQSAIFGVNRGEPGQRIALKIVTAAEELPAGPLTVVAEDGQRIEGDNGVLVDGALGSVSIGTQELGSYHEWLMDPDGNWLLVARWSEGEAGGMPDGQIVIQGVPVVIQGVPLVNTVPGFTLSPLPPLLSTGIRAPRPPITIATPARIVPLSPVVRVPRLQPLAPVPLAGTVIELEDAFADESLEMDSAGEKFRVATALQELVEGRVMLDFTLRVTSVSSTDYEEIGVQRFDPTGFEHCTLRLVAEMDVAAFGQVAELQLVELNTGSEVTTLSTDRTETTPCAAALVLPSEVTLYSVRLRRTGGNASLRVACRSVALELTNA